MSLFPAARANSPSNSVPLSVSIACIGADKNASIPRSTRADERALLDETIMAKPIREYRSIAVIAYTRLP
ncbi:MAG: hypothetical protein R1F54_10550 [Candidatus Zeuxoniibacter abyssi]|nr:MAG: hypothetical protein R1F54_10550 [Candidatus Persebacteraceae bacterium AB1(2)]